MPIDVKLTDDIGAHVEGRAAQEFANVVRRFAKDLTTEVHRLEAAAKNGQGDPEVTTTMVQDAEIFLRRYARKRASRGLQAIKSGAAIGALTTGLIFRPEKFSDGAWLAVFIVVLSATLVTTIISITKE